MLGRSFAAIFLVFAAATGLVAQVPSQVDATLLLKLGGSDAGSETFHVEALASGGYFLRTDVNLQVPGLHLIQNVEARAGSGFEFIDARVLAVVNGDTSTVTLTREGGLGIQVTEGGASRADTLETPANSILVTNNVMLHVVQFAWLHSAGIGESRSFFAFPRVPIDVELQYEGQVSKDGQALSIRRYYLNVANQLGIYVWVDADGEPLKLIVPLQAFEGVNEAYSDWAPLLDPKAEETGTNASAPPPYDAEDVEFASGDITLAGTVTTPRGAGPWPAVVLITGSGPQNRDEDTEGPGGLKMGIFRVIADTLTRRGIAVLRYDDRGVGGSGGSLATAGLSDLVHDVEAAVRYLRARDGIDPARVGLVGHSEGGIIAPIVAADDSRITAVVLMAGTAAPLDSVIMDQVAAGAIEAGADSASVAQTRKSIGEFAEAIRQGADTDSIDVPDIVRTLASNRKWFKEHMENLPEATIRQVRAPVLIVSGGADVQVPPVHAERLGAALDDVDHPDHEVRIFPDLNHLLAVSKGQGTAEYADPTAKVDPGFLTYMADWLVARLGVR
jgi:pimeloyl-ACP methyl ester carboxylesterase